MDNASPTLANMVPVAATNAHLPILLVRAIVLTESSADLYAYRAEPLYRYLWDIQANRPFRALSAAENASDRAPKDFPYDPKVGSRDTEWWGQQASWGPMQIMGAVAREYGFKGRFPKLCSQDGVAYGCRHLEALRDRYLADFGWEGVVAAYNAGSPRKTDGGAWVNQDYVDKVRKNGGLNGSDAA